VTRGRGKNKTKLSDVPSQKDLIDEGNKVKVPNIEIKVKEDPRQCETTNTLGMTFTAQDTNKGETTSNKREKRKVTVTSRLIQETSSQEASRRARAQKKMVETPNPLNERRTRSKRDIQEEDRSSVNQQDPKVQDEHLKIPTDTGNNSKRGEVEVSKDNVTMDVVENMDPGDK